MSIPPPGTLTDDRALAEEATRRGYEVLPRWVSDFEAMEAGSFWSGAWSLGRPVVDMDA